MKLHVYKIMVTENTRRFLVPIIIYVISDHVLTTLDCMYFLWH